MCKWSFAIYLRLSSEDGDKDESNSITNQKMLLKNYLSQLDDVKIYDIYIDDGYTGTDFERPDFKRMIKDIENKYVNGVIIKDLSRLGRDYIGTGDFIDETIPNYNLRFISVNDNVDSFLDPSSMHNLEISIKNLMNDNYAKDTSYKLRTSLKVSKKNGNFIGVIAPFGYIKDKEDIHKLIIDKEASKIIKNIFNMVLEGKSRQQIVDYLNFNHILTPSLYFKNILKYNIGNVSNEWTLKILDSVLKNETYTGKLIQGKFCRINHKTHNIVRKAEEEWIVVDNTHKEIISKEIFNQVQNILYGRNCKVNKNGEYDTFNGYLKCADCNCNMNKNSRVKKDKKQVFYYCSTYRRTKKCSKHFITDKDIEESVIEIINNQISTFCNISKIVDKEITFSNIEYNEEINKIKLVEIDKEINKYEILLKEIIDDYKDDIITKEDFDSYNISYLYELNNLKLKKEHINNIKSEKIDLSWLYKFRDTEKIEKLNKKFIDEFIENIYIYEDRKLKIVFKYQDKYEELIKYLKSRKIMV